MKNNGYAILGAGIFAKEAHLAALAALGSSAPPLKAIYSRSEGSAQSLASDAQKDLNLSASPDVYSDGSDSSKSLDALLGRADITSVIVVLPITHMLAIILKSLAAGKHVISEKPVGPDVASGAELIKTYFDQYQLKGLIWRVAENYEAEPGIRAAAEAIRDGKIGKVQAFSVRVVGFIDESSKFYKTSWRTVPDYQGGFLLDGGVHTAAALRVLLPSPMTHISSFASLNKPYLVPHDTIHAIIKTADGATGTFEMTFGSPTPSRAADPSANETVISGSEGWLRLARDGNNIKVVIHTKDDQEEVIEEERRGVQDELASFFRAIEVQSKGEALAEVDKIGDPRGALEDVRLIQAALNSNGNLLELVNVK